MTDEVSWREGRRPTLDDDPGVPGAGVVRSRQCREGGTSDGGPSIDSYDEGLERYFALSSWLAFLGHTGASVDEESAALRAELSVLERELSERARELSLSEIGALLREPRDDPR